MSAQNELTPGYHTEGGEVLTYTRKGDRFIAAGIGAGTSYGNLGIKITSKLTKGFGLSAAIGTRTFPLSIPINVSISDELLELGLPFINKTLKGMSMNIGFDAWINNFCIGFHYAQYGKWTSLYDNQRKTLHGFLFIYEGHIPLGKLPLAITVGGNFGFAFGKDKFLELVEPTINGDGDFFTTLFVGLDVGICYKFKY
jgi:hypothetical protein